MEQLDVYMVEETSLSVSWLPPSAGYFDHFLVEVSLNGDIIHSQKMLVHFCSGSSNFFHYILYVRIAFVVEYLKIYYTA